MLYGACPHLNCRRYLKKHKVVVLYLLVDTYMFVAGILYIVSERGGDDGRAEEGKKG